MLANGQTLRHKEEYRLARLDPVPGESWAWNLCKKTAFIAEDGSKFLDDIENWTHVADELGRPYFNLPAKGQFVDESAKKYLVSEEELAKMRKDKLEKWEAQILDRMENGGPSPSIKYIAGIKTTCYVRGSSDVAGKSVACPFADGSGSSLCRDFFLKRREAIPLYRKWGTFDKEYTDGPLVFRHTDGQIWLYDNMMSELRVIEEGSINTP